MEPKTAAAILQGVWDESGGRISVDEAVQKCTAKRVDAAEVQQFGAFAKRVADAIAMTEDMEESKRKEMTMGDVESTPAATAKAAVSQYAGVLEQTAGEFLTEVNETLKKPIDFTTCLDEFAAVETFSKVFGTDQFTLWGKTKKDLYLKFAAAIAAFDKKTDETPALSTDNMSLSLPFKSTYIGDANKEFYNYVDQCWETYTTRHDNYRYPYCAIVQSSGFGKTRLLRELAVQFQREEETRSAAKTEAPVTGRQRLVYVNVRQPNSSSGYPRRTEALAAHFFTTMKTKTDDIVIELADKLLQLFQFVMQPGVARAPDTTDNSSSSMSAKLLQLFDAEDKEFTQDLQAVSTAFPKQPPTDRYVLIVAVDEARALLPTAQDEGIGWFRILRRALERANTEIRVKFTDTNNSAVKSGIFGIVVDTNSKISDFVPPAIMDPSQRKLVPEKLVLFPPFVLTHTMDVLHATTIDEKGRILPVKQDQVDQTLKRYKDEVTTAITKLPEIGFSWKRLSQLGRPLWLKLDPETLSSRKKLIDLAAQKLLCGSSPDKASSFNEETMNGVASMLCRVGIRPYASSPLAAGIVADFMAVLSYVGYTSETFVTTYSSDPILTLGATRVWHSGGTNDCVLAKKILPQLRKMLHQEVMETGGIGEMVARIVLLLAMDACHLLNCGPQEEDVSHWSGAGEFFSVWTFLTALQGDEPGLRMVDDITEDATKRDKAEAKADAETKKAVPRQNEVKSEAEEAVVGQKHAAAATTPKGNKKKAKTLHVEMKAEGKAPALQTGATSGDAETKTPNVPNMKSKKSKLVARSREEAREACATVKARWKDWFVSFTHFMQLAQVPSEACLWAMLGRRAAGIMPRNQKGVDLVIPICTVGDKGRARVSMIFVQVKNLEQNDSAFPSSATVKMHPSSVFVKTKSKESATGSVSKPATGTEPVESGIAPSETLKAETKQQTKRREKAEEAAKFAALGPDSVLRVYMSLRSKHAQRFYLEDKCGDDDETSYVLCLKGLAPTSALPLRENHHVRPEPVNVLTSDVVDELKKLCLSWWKVKTLVELDVDCRDKEEIPEKKGKLFGLDKTTQAKLALKPMAEVLLLNSDGAERISANESGLGRVSVVNADSGHPPSRNATNHGVAGTFALGPVSKQSTGGKSKRSSESELSNKLPPSKRPKK